MKYWYDQFKTGRRIMKRARLVNLVGQPGFEIEGDEVCAGLGDIIASYVRHCRKPWWRRGIGWKHDKADMERVLNVLNLSRFQLYFYQGNSFLFYERKEVALSNVLHD